MPPGESSIIESESSMFLSLLTQPPVSYPNCVFPPNNYRRREANMWRDTCQRL